MSTVEVNRDEKENTKLIIDGEDITNWVYEYRIIQNGTSPPEIDISMNLEPVVELDDANIGWRINLPEERVLRKAIYDRLKDEFEGGDR